MTLPAGGATFSDDGLYRYELWRQWDHAVSALTFVMLNPSTANETDDDPTIRRCMGFARREGLGGIRVVNLFALRCTRPVHLFDGTVAGDPNGPDNLKTVRTVLNVAKQCAAPVVVAWGASTQVHRSTVFNECFRGTAEDFWCLGMCANGGPRHPLYLSTLTPLVRWWP